MPTRQALGCLHGRFETKRINHSVAYATDEANTNQAESFFARLRRAEIGQHHHLSGPLPQVLRRGDGVARGYPARA
jgi:hypothetical protein